MKEIIAIIRPKKVSATKNALDTLGYPSMTAIAVLGRGKQRGLANEVSFPINSNLKNVGKGLGMKFIPKRYLSLVVEDEHVKEVLDTIATINRTGQVGDGKIFVCPIDNTIRIRTKESGNAALI